MAKEDALVIHGVSPDEVSDEIREFCKHPTEMKYGAFENAVLAQAIIDRAQALGSWDVFSKSDLMPYLFARFGDRPIIRHYLLSGLQRLERGEYVTNWPTISDDESVVYYYQVTDDFVAEANRPHDKN